MRFAAPVDRDDTIYIEAEVHSKRETRKPDGGVVTFRMDTRNQRGEVVLSYNLQF